MQNIEKNNAEEINERKENKPNRLKAYGMRIKERLAEKDEREVRKRLRRFIGFAIIAAVVALLGGAELFFGTFPISIALICSSRKHLPAVALGLCFALLGGLPSIYAYTCVAILLGRVLFTLVPVIFTEIAKDNTAKSREMIKYKSDAVEAQGSTDNKQENLLISSLGTLFCEDFHVKILIAVLGGALCGFLILTENDFSFYGFCAMVVLTTLSPLFTAALGGVLGEERYIKKAYSVMSIGVIFFFTVLGAKNGSVLGMPLSPILAMLLTLYVSSDKGVIYGVATAIVCGLAFEPIYIPLLVLSAVVFCLVSAVKRNAGVAAVCALIVIWCYYIGGESGLIYVLPPMLLSIPIYMIADKYREMMLAPYRRSGEAEGVYFAEAVTEKNE